MVNNKCTRATHLYLEVILLFALAERAFDEFFIQVFDVRIGSDDDGEHFVVDCVGVVGHHGALVARNSPLRVRVHRAPGRRVRTFRRLCVQQLT